MKAFNKMVSEDKGNVKPLYKSKSWNSEARLMSKLVKKSQLGCVRWALCEHLTSPCHDFACGSLRDDIICLDIATRQLFFKRNFIHSFCEELFLIFNIFIYF